MAVDCLIHGVTDPVCGRNASNIGELLRALQYCSCSFLTLPPTSTLHRRTAARPRPRASGAPPGDNVVGSCHFFGSCHRSTIRKDEGGEANRGTYAPAATKLYVFVFFFIVVSTNLPFSSSSMNSGTQRDREDASNIVAKVHQEEQRWLDTGGGGWRMKET